MQVSCHNQAPLSFVPEIQSRLVRPPAVQRTVRPRRYTCCPQPTTYQPTRRFRSSPFPDPVSPMSTSNQTTDLSTTNFTAIFDAASNEYKTLTKQDLETHPFAVAFENSNSPDSVMNVFRKQAQVFKKFCKGDDKLMAWLTPIVNILFTFSGTLGEGIGLVSIQSFYDISTLRHPFLAFLSRKDDLHGHWCSSWGRSIPTFLHAHSYKFQLRQ